METTRGKIMSDLPATKLSQIRAALAAGDNLRALSIAAKFPRLGEQKSRITRGHAAAQSPAFYRELGHDPDALVADAIAAMRERWAI